MLEVTTYLRMQHADFPSAYFSLNVIIGTLSKMGQESPPPLHFVNFVVPGHKNISYNEIFNLYQGPFWVSWWYCTCSVSPDHAYSWLFPTSQEVGRKFYTISVKHLAMTASVFEREREGKGRKQKRRQYKTSDSEMKGGVLFSSLKLLYDNYALPLP